MRHVTYEWGMSRGYVKYAKVISLLNASCHLWMRHVTRIRQIRKSHVTCLHKSPAYSTNDSIYLHKCPAYLTKNSPYLQESPICPHRRCVIWKVIWLLRICNSHCVLQIRKSHITFECVMSLMNEACHADTSRDKHVIWLLREYSLFYRALSQKSPIKETILATLLLAKHDGASTVLHTWQIRKSHVTCMCAQGSTLMQIKRLFCERAL